MAGTAGGRAYADGSGTAARFNDPRGLAVDNLGNVYIADYGNQVIRKMTPGGVVTTLAGNPGETGSTDGTGAAARFNGPASVAVDVDGNVYVADSGNHTIRKITPAGAVTTFAGTAGVAGSANGTGVAAQFNKPSGVALDGDRNLYVADTDNRTIRKITPAKVVTTFAGTPGVYFPGGLQNAALFTNPMGIAVSSGGDVYVADIGNYTIRKISPAGEVSIVAGSEWFGWGFADSAYAGDRGMLALPNAVAVDPSGAVYVTDNGNFALRKITSAGALTTFAGSGWGWGKEDGPALQAAFSNPSGIARASDGTLYVADDEMIRKISSGGAVTTIAGAKAEYGNVDGPGNLARFWRPQGVGLAGDGAYVAAGSTIRRIANDGTVTTVAGLVGVPGAVDGQGGTARFSSPAGVAVGPSGAVYVADKGNYTVRKISPDGAVTTLAGAAGQGGSDDGVGSAARFRSFEGLAVDASGNVYVADANNCTIRKITVAGSVTTLAGSAREEGHTDGTGSAARFSYPTGIAVSADGVIYVADTYNHTIRKITFGGVVTTFAGAAQERGLVDGTSSTARFNNPTGVAVDGNGVVYVADCGNQRVRRITPAGVVTTIGSGVDGVPFVGFRAPYGIAADSTGNLCVIDTGNYVIVAGNNGLPVAPALIRIAPLPQTNTAGTAAMFLVRAEGAGPIAYRWQVSTNGGMSWTNVTEGAGFVGATAPMLVVTTTLAQNGSQFRCIVQNAQATVTSDPALLSVTNPVAAVDKVYAWSHLAGSLKGAGFADGPAHDARFLQPNGAAVASNGDIFVADRGNHVIRKVSGGVVTTWAGTPRVPGSADGTRATALFNSPTALLLDGSGNLFVSDSGNHTIRRISSSGDVTTFAGNAGQPGAADGSGPAARFNSPEGLARATNGDLYVADFNNHTIRKVTLAGVVTTFAGLAGDGGAADGPRLAARFYNPSDLAFAPGGALLVADSGGYTIRKIAADGEVSVLAGAGWSSFGSADGTGIEAQFNYPCGIVVDVDGNAYVADTCNGKIRRVTPEGVVTTIAGVNSSYDVDGSGAEARFNFPAGIAFDPDGDLVVTTLNSASIRRVTMAGEVTTLAGGDAEKGSVDGVGAAARFNGPSGLVPDGFGGLFVADAMNSVIRHLAADGATSTIAGVAGEAGDVDGPAGVAQLNFPYYIGRSASGELYVSADAAIRRVEPSGAISTLAGVPGEYGQVDGNGSAARFGGSIALAVDAYGDVFVADYYNHLIRRVTSAGVVSTFAGVAGDRGSTDGTSAARFDSPGGIAVDSHGNVFVLDAYGTTIRKITALGVVSTLAGVAGAPEWQDGVGAAACFRQARGIVVGSDGMVYVADTGNNRVRRVGPDGMVTTLGGGWLWGADDGVGGAAEFDDLMGICVGTDGSIFVADSNNQSIRKGVPLSGVAAWRQRHFGISTDSSNAANMADPDSDGRVNLLEYALGANPAVADATGGPAIGTVLDAQGRHLTLTFDRIADPALTYTVEASNDLVVWTSIWASTGAANVVGTVTATDSGASQQTNSRRFLRLKVSY